MLSRHTAKLLPEARRILPEGEEDEKEKHKTLPHDTGGEGGKALLLEKRLLPMRELKPGPQVTRQGRIARGRCIGVGIVGRESVLTDFNGAVI